MFEEVNEFGQVVKMDLRGKGYERNIKKVH